MVTAVGSPSATSRANDGPDNTATGTPGRYCSTSRWLSVRVFGSMPLHARQILKSRSGSVCSSRSTSANPAQGVASKTCLTPAGKGVKRRTTVSLSGNACPGRWWLLHLSSISLSRCESRQSHRKVGCPLRASIRARAVPQEPAPATITGQTCIPLNAVVPSQRRVSAGAAGTGHRSSPAPAAIAGIRRG